MLAGKAHQAAQFILCCAVQLSMVAGLAGTAAAQAVAPSLYLGLGTGTNVGGTVGMGLEVRVGQHLAASAAVGFWPEALREATTAGGAFDFDLGLKYYPTGRWLFTGLNYGLIHAEIFTPRADNLPGLRKRRGFTFSLGLRTPSYRSFYTSGFVGVTSNTEANHFTVFDRRTFVPHFGLMVGYEFSSIH